MARSNVTIKLLETDQQIVDKILLGLASQANHRVTVAARKSMSQISDYVRGVILKTPEMVELESGVLRGEFGLTPGKAAAAVEDIANRVGASVTVKATRITPSTTGGLKGGIFIFIQPVNFSNVIVSPQAIVTTEKGKKLDWLKWLLFEGDAIIIDNYEFRFKKGTGRSGLGTMAEVKSGVWRVPPEYAGTEDRNFITRALQTEKSANAIATILYTNMVH